MTANGIGRPEMDLEEKALLLRTLGHPVRLKIVAGLAGKCACVKEIWECLRLPQAIVSQHLKVMKKNGILDAKRDGVRVCYSLKNEMMAELVTVLLAGK
ncbi:ArsR/SmtB family transcription factor [Geotalea uraniireducens]|uniref:Transcriptional regulator, ArsR family n=1 Tax=Geotalea uraniireducens (strain Rf4) TaxID=351605 RepID=A5G998_GEOUR|nr:metalloregulator ArsR/SmtB family transcription factor [Geotalea uraniireducens]ABQ28366.1 transcriptional regulator, ArsR family [Geotalea uraniireducens Rf4]